MMSHPVACTWPFMYRIDRLWHLNCMFYYKFEKMVQIYPPKPWQWCVECGVWESAQVWTGMKGIHWSYWHFLHAMLWPAMSHSQRFFPSLFGVLAIHISVFAHSSLVLCPYYTPWIFDKCLCLWILFTGYYLHTTTLWTLAMHWIGKRQLLSEVKLHPRTHWWMDCSVLLQVGQELDLVFHLSIQGCSVNLTTTGGMQRD